MEVESENMNSRDHTLNCSIFRPVSFIKSKASCSLVLDCSFPTPKPPDLPTNFSCPWFLKYWKHEQKSIEWQSKHLSLLLGLVWLSRDSAMAMILNGWCFLTLVLSCFSSAALLVALLYSLKRRLSSASGQISAKNMLVLISYGQKSFFWKYWSSMLSQYSIFLLTSQAFSEPYSHILLKYSLKKLSCRTLCSLYFSSSLSLSLSFSLLPSLSRSLSLPLLLL